MKVNHRGRGPRLYQRGGFTLIELLVVIAIIALLASLSLPFLSKAKDKAHLTTCRNNLRQIALGSQMYVHDFEMYAPFWNFPSQGQGGAAGRSRRWWETLEPFVGARWPKCNAPDYGTEYYMAKVSPAEKGGTYVCPGYNRLNGIYGGGSGTPEGAHFDAGAYAYNWIGVGRFTTKLFGDRYALGLGGGFDSPTRAPFALTRESQVVAPADMIAFGDSGIGFPLEEKFGPIHLNYGLQDRSLRGLGLEVAEKQTRLSKYSLRHAGPKFNIAFADGHLETLPPEEVFKVNNAAVARRWNKDNQPHLDEVERITTH
ncbi:MAG TPA: type II secretion system protein [Verrucomicrobiae bacterium]